MQPIRPLISDTLDALIDAASQNASTDWRHRRFFNAEDYKRRLDRKMQEECTHIKDMMLRKKVLAKKLDDRQRYFFLQWERAKEEGDLCSEEEIAAEKKAFYHSLDASAQPQWERWEYDDTRFYEKFPGEVEGLKAGYNLLLQAPLPSQLAEDDHSLYLFQALVRVIGSVSNDIADLSGKNACVSLHLAPRRDALRLTGHPRLPPDEDAPLQEQPLLDQLNPDHLTRLKQYFEPEGWMARKLEDGSQWNKRTSQRGPAYVIEAEKDKEGPAFIAAHALSEYAGYAPLKRDSYIVDGQPLTERQAKIRLQKSEGHRPREVVRSLMLWGIAADDIFGALGVDKEKIPYSVKGERQLY